MVSKESKRKSGSEDAPYQSKKSKTEDGDDAAEGLTKSAQKRQVRKERQSQRRHADVVEEAKSIWNKLRLKTNTKDDTRKLADRLMGLIEGKISEIALQHDASRVVQAAIQFGTMDQRKIVLKELCAANGSLPEISKIQYAQFCCLKLIKYCHRDAECTKTIVRAFKGHIPKLAVHGIASKVVESLFVTLPTKATVPLKQEFYGPHFSLFAASVPTDGPISPTLMSNLKDASENQKKSAIAFVKDIVSKSIQKSFFGYSYFQDLFYEYAEVADGSDIRALIPGVADHAIHMLSTRSGAKAVATCASYGTPKDRKRLLKSLKGYTRSSLLHRDAYLALLRIVQVTDDTVSVNKSILNEILTKPPPASNDESNASAKDESPLLELALDENASKLFLFFLPSDDKVRMKYFDPLECEVLNKIATIRENGKDVPTSRKDADIRQRELLGHLKAGLIELCSAHADELMRSVPGSRVLKEVYAAFSSEQVVSACVDACVATLDATDDAATSLFEDRVGHIVIKNMIGMDAEKSAATDTNSNEKDGSNFSQKLFERTSDRLMDVAASNRGAFVLTGLCKVKPLRKDVISKLQSSKKKLQKLSKGKSATAGYVALVNEIS